MHLATPPRIPLITAALALAYDRYVADFADRLAAGTVGGAPVGIREFEDTDGLDWTPEYDDAAVRQLATKFAQNPARLATLLTAYDSALLEAGEDWQGRPRSLVAVALSDTADSPADPFSAPGGLGVIGRT